MQKSRYEFLGTVATFAANELLRANSKRQQPKKAHPGVKTWKVIDAAVDKLAEDCGYCHDAPEATDWFHDVINAGKLDQKPEVPVEVHDKWVGFAKKAQAAAGLTETVEEKFVPSACVTCAV